MKENKRKFLKVLWQFSKEEMYPNLISYPVPKKNFVLFFLQIL